MSDRKPDPDSLKESIDDINILARKIWEILGKSALPSNTRAVLGIRIVDSTVRWALALTLAIWFLSQKDWPAHKHAQQIMKEAGGMALLEIIVLPKSALDLLQATSNSKSELDSAMVAALLEKTLVELPLSAHPAITSWLQSQLFFEIGRSLLLRFPEPGSARPPLWGSPPQEPTEPRRPAPSRMHRFDRADFAARKPQKS